MLGTVSLFPHLLGSQSLPVPLQRQLGIKQPNQTDIRSFGLVNTIIVLAFAARQFAAVGNVIFMRTP